MARTTISEQISELQQENERLKMLQKLFDKAVKNEFEMDIKSLHKVLENDADFGKKIAAYFGLKSRQDFEDFITVFCSENSLNFFKNHRKK